MKSTLRIDVVENNEPVIRIKREDTSDLRDKFLGIFLERLQHSSSLCFIEYTGTPGIWDIHSLPLNGEGWYQKIPIEQQMFIFLACAGPQHFNQLLNNIKNVLLMQTGDSCVASISSLIRQFDTPTPLPNS